MNRLIRFAIITLLLFGLTGAVYSEAVSEKAKAKRIENLQYLVFLEVPVANFGSDEQKKTYSDIKKEYAKGLSFFFEDDYYQAYLDFISVQKKLEKLFEELSLNYMTRTRELLQNANNRIVDITIAYHRDSQKVRRFLKKRDVSKKPPEPQIYDPQSYHFTYDKRAIVNNMDLGFAKLGNAKRVRQKAMDIEKYLENNKKLSPSMRKMRIEHYMAAIKLCREGKLNGVKVYQLIQRYKKYNVQKDYKDNYYAIEKRLNPVFDFSIPDQYKIDANDGFNRIHMVEECLYRDQKPPKECKGLTDA